VQNSPWCLNWLHKLTGYGVSCSTLFGGLFYACLLMLFASLGKQFSMLDPRLRENYIPAQIDSLVQSSSLRNSRFRN
jgi:hypothetical protein